MQFGPGSSEWILSQGIHFFYLGLYNQQVVGASPKMRVVVLKSVWLTSRYLIRLYQFPVHGDWEQKINYYLTAGAHNSPTAWYKILEVYAIEDFVVLLGFCFGYILSSQPILELLLNLPVVHVTNVEAAFTVLCPVSGLPTASAHVWEGLCLPCCVNIHGNWVAWHGGRVCEMWRKDTSGRQQGFLGSKRSKSMWHRPVYVRPEKLHPPHDSGPSGQRGETTHSGLCLKASLWPFLQESQRFDSPDLDET